jgi:hypothetical protein
MRVLAYRGKRITAEPFKLNPKHIYNVNLFDNLVERIAYTNRQPVYLCRHKCRRTNEYYFGTEFCHCPHIAAGDPRVRDITDNGYFQTFKCASDFTNGIDVQEALCGMLAESVAGVYNTGIHIPAQERGRPSGTVTNHNNVNTHSFQVLGGIQQGLTFTDGTGFPGELYDVGAQSACGQSKAVSRPRAVFKK